jgi:hypothetical protein
LFILVVRLQKVTVDIPEVDDLNLGRDGAKVKGGDLDRADERGPCHVGELGVEGGEERGGEGIVEDVPGEVDRHGGGGSIASDGVVAYVRAWPRPLPPSDPQNGEEKRRKKEGEEDARRRDKTRCIDF